MKNVMLVFGGLFYLLIIVGLVYLSYLCAKTDSMLGYLGSLLSLLVAVGIIRKGTT